MISIVIPCHYEHFGFISPLLEHYRTHTLLPDEIIIVISEANKIRSMIKNFKMDDNLFEIKIIKLSKKSFAGNSRRIGVRNARGDIVILQDADDLPHIQRTEIISNLFKKYRKIVFICHKWTKTGTFHHINKPEISFPRSNIFRNKRFRKINHITNGNIAFRKIIANKINWFTNLKRRQDIATNIYLIDLYRRRYIFVKEELLFYRHNNSTNKINKKIIRQKIKIKNGKRKIIKKKINPYKIIINGKRADIS